jgi:septum formation protein
MSPLVYLASLSPRRHELLLQIGVDHEVVGVDVDERRLPGEPPADYVVRLASAKAGAAAGSRAVARQPLPVLGADTAVVVDGEVLGKPRDRAEALGMLARLSGRTHEVVTGVALATAASVLTRVSLSRVGFRELDDGEMARYWASGEPADKAGAYGIQGLGAVFVSRIEGSYSGVVGLPLFETAEMLRGAGIRLPFPRPENRTE